MGWFRRLGRWRRAEVEIEEEIRFHLAQEAQLRIDRGQPPDAAAAAARRDFGNVLLVKETTRDAWGWTLVRDAWRDLRYALRLLRRSPAFAVVAASSLGLGIGANSAIFSLTDAVIFRPLPVDAPDRLLQVRGVHERGVQLGFSYPVYRDIRDRQQAFTSIAATSSSATLDPMTLELPAAGRRDIYARFTLVTGSYFPALAIRPSAGRLFTPDDDRAPGAHPVAVVTHRFWKTVLGGDSAVTSIRLTHNGVSYAIVGVTPATFRGISSNDDPDVWFPMMMADAALLGNGVPEARGTQFMYVFGRLKPGVDAAAAATDLARVFAEIQRIYPDVERARGDVLPMARGVQTLRTRFERPLYVLLAVVGLLLIIACTNLAALLMARAAGRRHEIATRLSLGASPVRLLRQFFIESLVIAGLGAVVGLSVSTWSASLLIEMVTTGPRRLPIVFSLDTRVLAFTGTLSILAAVVFGVLPALQATRSSLARSGARISSPLPGGRLLIAGQMALSIFLLIASGLFIRSLGNLRHIDTGFARDNVLVLMLDVAPAYGTDGNKYLAMYPELAGRIEQLPGVQAASFARETFFTGNASRGNIAYEGQPGEAPRSEWPYKIRVTPRFQDTFGLSLIAGRRLNDGDDRRRPKVAVVSESIAKRYFNGPDAVGKRFCFCSAFAASDPKDSIEIVGVVRDVRYGSLRESSPYTVYMHVEQQPPSRRADLHVRTLTDPAALAAQVQEAVRRFNPQIRITHTTTLDRLIEESIVQDRLLATVSTAFAVLAVVLAAVGLYGITSYGVHRRTNEIGIRVALGASRGEVKRMVLREVVLLVAAGAAVGIPAALAASGLVRSLLFDLAPTDPMTVAGATLVLFLVALVAGYLPAQRATRIDPLAALRME
jgi:predicted permease